MSKTTHSHRHLHRVRGSWSGHAHEHYHLTDREAAIRNEANAKDDLLTPAHRHHHRLTGEPTDG